MARMEPEDNPAGLAEMEEQSGIPFRILPPAVISSYRTGATEEMAVAVGQEVKAEPEARVEPAEMEPAAPAIRAVQETVAMVEMVELAAVAAMAPVAAPVELAVTLAIFTSAIRKTVVPATSLLAPVAERAVAVVPAAWRE